MYRQTLSELAFARGWEVHLYDANAVVAQAVRMLAHRADRILHGPRATATVGERPSDRARRDDCPQLNQVPPDSPEALWIRSLVPLDSS